MAVSGPPVVIATNGFGMAVRPVTANAPILTIATNGFGAPIVISDRGAPFILQGGAPAYDYLVTSDAEWNAVMANSDATLSGKTMAISGTNFTDRSIQNRTFSTPFSITSLNSGSKLPGVTLRANTNLSFIGLNLQKTGAWATGVTALIKYLAGTSVNTLWIGCTFRGGYGASFANLDGTATYPEYTRIDNVQTATVTSARFALAFQDAAATSAWIEFFNRGAANVYYKIGDNTVVATTSDTLAIPSANSVRSAAFNPQTATHIAILSVSGSQQINARTEVGMSQYLASAFSAEGGVFHNGFTFTGNTLSDLNNNVKSFGVPTGNPVIMDNVIRRPYQDLIAVSGYNAGAGEYLYVLRNQMEVPIARSGIAEANNGDARDPHGDGTLQTFASTPTPLRRVIVAGNRQIPALRRTGVESQNIFISDSDDVYEDIFAIGNVLVGGASRAISLGETADVRYCYVVGNTAANLVTPANGANIIINQAAGYPSYVGFNIANAVPTAGADTSLEGNIIPNSANMAATFPNWANRLTGSTAADLEAALATAGTPASGAGYVANAASWLDYATPIAANVVKWANLPPGVGWLNQTDVAISTLITLPLRKVMAGPSGMAVVPSAGVAWQSASDAAGASVVTAWTTSPGTVNMGQFIQFRATSSAAGLTPTNITATVNGYTVGATVTTVSIAPNFGYTATGPLYTAVATTGTHSEATVVARIKIDSTSAFDPIVTETGSQLFIRADTSTRQLQMQLNDSVGVVLATTNTATNIFPIGTFFELKASYDIVALRARIWVDGVLVLNATPSAGSGANQTNRKYTFGATATGAAGALESLYIWLIENSDGSVPGSAPFISLVGPAAAAEANTAWVRTGTAPT